MATWHTLTVWWSREGKPNFGFSETI